MAEMRPDIASVLVARSVVAACLPIVGVVAAGYAFIRLSTTMQLALADYSVAAATSTFAVASRYAVDIGVILFWLVIAIACMFFRQPISRLLVRLPSSPACPKCRYTLGKTYPDVCPECGLRLTAAKR
ncbi:MAG: hypothetical protein AAF747_07260 [Planctomycetota bacterium]